MTFDILHMIATIVILFVVIWGLDHTSVLDSMSKKGKTITKVVIIFLAIFLLNLIWPYGSGA